MNTERFHNKVVIITGAGSGIGAATARRFAAEGASVILVGRTEQKLKLVAEGLTSPSNHLIQVADVSISNDVTRMISHAADRFGRIDVLVNNAGTARSGSFLDMPVETWRVIFGTNLEGVIHVSRAALPYLLETKGVIVNVSSLSGLGGDWGLNFYNAAKGAVSNLTKSLALEFGGKGVRVNAVSPSLVFTDILKPVMERYPELLKQSLARNPMGRGGQPEEVASAIAFLASDDASYINGVDIPLDGGTHASNGQARIL